MKKSLIFTVLYFTLIGLYFLGIMTVVTKFVICLATIIFLLLNKKRKIISGETVMKEILAYWATITILGVVSSIIFPISGNSENQERLNNMRQLNFMKETLETVVLSPIAEEIIFRMIPAQMFRKWYYYIPFSASIFALMHVVYDPMWYYYVWLYVPPAFYLSWRYYKTQSLQLSVAIHSFHNLWVALNWLRQPTKTNSLVGIGFCVLDHSFLLLFYTIKTFYIFLYYFDISAEASLFIDSS